MRRRSSSTPKTSRQSSAGCAGWLLIPLLLAFAALLLPLASVLSVSAQTPEWVPYSLHSMLKADYSAEFSKFSYPGLEINIIWETILDQDSHADPARFARVKSSLLTPVPTLTPRFSSPATLEPQVQPTAVPTHYSRPRATAMIPWDPTETFTPRVQPTATGRPAAKPMPSSTPPPPSKPKSTRPAPLPQPTEAPEKPTDPPRPEKPPDPYPQPDPGEPRPNPYP